MRVFTSDRLPLVTGDIGHGVGEAGTSVSWVITVRPASQDMSSVFTSFPNIISVIREVQNQVKSMNLPLCFSRTPVVQWQEVSILQGLKMIQEKIACFGMAGGTAAQGDKTSLSRALRASSPAVPGSQSLWGWSGQERCCFGVL